MTSSFPYFLGPGWEGNNCFFFKTRLGVELSTKQHKRAKFTSWKMDQYASCAVSLPGRFCDDSCSMESETVSRFFAVFLIVS